MSACSSFLPENLPADPPEEGNSFTVIGRQLYCTSCDFYARYDHRKRMAQHILHTHRNKYFYCTYFQCREKELKVKPFYMEYIYIYIYILHTSEIE